MGKNLISKTLRLVKVMGLNKDLQSLYPSTKLKGWSMKPIDVYGCHLLYAINCKVFLNILERGCINCLLHKDSIKICNPLNPSTKLKGWMMKLIYVYGCYLLFVIHCKSSQNILGIFWIGHIAYPFGQFHFIYGLDKVHIMKIKKCLVTVVYLCTHTLRYTI